MTARPDIDHDWSRIAARGCIYRFETRGDLIHESRIRDARLILGGVIAGLVIAIGALSWVLSMGAMR